MVAPVLALQLQLAVLLAGAGLGPSRALAPDRLIAVTASAAHKQASIPELECWSAEPEWSI
jgi:hypothetical protein